METEHGQGEALDEIENTLRLHRYIPEPESSSLMMEGLGVFQGGPGLTRGPKVVVFVVGLGRPKLEGGIQMIGGECATATDVQFALQTSARRSPQD